MTNPKHKLDNAAAITILITGLVMALSLASCTNNAGSPVEGEPAFHNNQPPLLSTSKQRREWVSHHIGNVRANPKLSSPLNARVAEYRAGLAAGSPGWAKDQVQVLIDTSLTNWRVIRRIERGTGHIVRKTDSSVTAWIHVSEISKLARMPETRHIQDLQLRRGPDTKLGTFRHPIALYEANIATAAEAATEIEGHHKNLVPVHIRVVETQPGDTQRVADAAKLLGATGTSVSPPSAEFSHGTIYSLVPIERLRELMNQPGAAIAWERRTPGTQAPSKH